MFQPPETFPQLRALLWAAPMVCTFFVTISAWMQGAQSTAWVIGLVTAVVIWVLTMAAVWVSRYGVRHSMVTASAMFLAFCVPLSLTLVPSVAPLARHGYTPMIATMGLQLSVLVLAAGFHARRACATPGLRHLAWPGCLIDLERHTIAKADRADAAVTAQLVSPALIGAGSVGLYHALKALLPAEALPMIALVVANAISAWLTTGPIARAWGQSIQLRRIERACGGRFASARLPWLEKERARSPIGQWVRRVLSTRA